MLGLIFSYLTVIYSIYFGLYQRKNHVGYVYKHLKHAKMYTDKCSLFLINTYNSPI